MRRLPRYIRAPVRFRIGCAYLTTSKLYRVESVHGALLGITDDEGDTIAINPKDCKHTGGIWELYTE